MSRRRRLRYLKGHLRAASHARTRRRRKPNRGANSERLRLHADRRTFRRRFYRREYHGVPEVIRVTGALGIETAENVDTFLSVANSLVDFQSRSLTIDLSECTKVWPSGITLLCSLAIWTELAAHGRRPQIRSVRPTDSFVELYLQQCGFYDFVGVPGPSPAHYSSVDVVRLRRETSLSALEERESDVVRLLRRHSCLTPENVELFDAKVLTEAFNNVTEHGITSGNQGWWILAQYHPTHRFISVCIADNGIGIRNTLMTGPQSASIRQRLGDAASDDQHIALALKESVSGALDANVRTRHNIITGSDKYPRGAHRGYGLRRIRETCRELRIPFSLVSQYGFARVDEDGIISRRESSSRRVFAGTLYHFVIPAQEGAT
jgi:hypothetical protein